MRLQSTVAAATAIGLVIGGAVVTGAPAQADDGTEYVQLEDFKNPANDAEENTAYNDWHFDPAHPSAGATQARNGIEFAVGSDALIMKGNGNNAKSETAVDSTTVDVLAKSLDAKTSDEDSVTYQIPVFYGTDATHPSYTTLRQTVADHADGSEIWTTSSEIPAAGGLPKLAKNAKDDIDDIAALLTANGNARPIGAGVLVYKPAVKVLVSSLTVNDAKTSFYEQPKAAQASGDVSEFVMDDEIGPNADTYAGWHEEANTSAAGYGSFATKVDKSGNATGLKVTGKSQLIYGFDADKRPTNIDLTDAVKGYEVEGSAVEGSNRNGFYSQIPIFFHREGESGQQFTTLRAKIPESGKLSEATSWTTSQKVGSIAKNGTATLEDLAAQLGDFEVLGFGFTVEQGQILVTRAAFNGYDFSFKKLAEPSPEPSASSSTSASPTTSATATTKPTTPAAKPATTSASVKFTNKSYVYNAAASATVTVKATGTKKTPSGTVKLKVYGKNYYADLNSKGTATIKLSSAVPVGPHKVTVTYLANNTAVFKNYYKTSAASYQITKATPKAAVKLSAKSIKASKKAKATVTVKVPGSLKAKSGKVKVAVYDGKKKIKTATTSTSGKVVVTLPKLKKGKHSIKVKTTATKNLKAATSKTAKLTVKK